MTKSQHHRPLRYGFIVSALAAPMIVAMSISLSGVPIFKGLFIGTVGFIIAVIPTMIFIVPLVYWLRRTGNLFSKYLYLTGIIGGALGLWFAFIFIDYSPQSAGEGYFIKVASSAIPSMAPGGVLGFLSAFGFCVGAGVPLNPFR